MPPTIWPPRPVSLVPAPRRRAWWVVVGLGVLVVAGGVIVHGDAQPLGIELRIQHGVDAHAGTAARWDTVFNTGIPWGIGLTLLGLGSWALATRWWRALAACAAVPLAIAITEAVLKPLVGRHFSGVYGYPSGHVTGVAAAVTLGSVLLGFRLRERPAVVLLVGLALGLCAAAVLAAVASHAHGPVDTVAGLPTGAAVARAWMLAIDALAAAVTTARSPA